MRIIISGEAAKGIGKMDRSLQEKFDSRIIKIFQIRPTRFLKDQNMEEVGDGRIISILI